MIKIINDIEKRFPVDEWRIDDICVWPLIRIETAMRLQSKNAISNSNKFPRFLSRIKQAVAMLVGWARYYHALIRDKAGNAKLDRSYDALFVDYTVSRTKLGNSYRNRLCGPIQEALDELGYSSLLCESSSKHEYRVPRYGKSLFIEKQINEVLLRCFLSQRTKPEECFLEGYAEAISYACSEYKISLPSITILCKRMNCFSSLEKFWDRILDVIKPKFVFVVCYYSLVNMALLSVCERKGIPTVDIQHGVQGHFHLAYGSWSRVPSYGYNVLPNYFLVWSEEEKNAIGDWSRKAGGQHRALVAGNLWLESWRDSNSPQRAWFEPFLQKYLVRPEGKVRILVTLQPICYPPAWFFAYLKKNSSRFDVWIRLHHTMIEKQRDVEKLIKLYELTDANLMEATELPLPGVLLLSDIHITLFSSVVIEAAQFHVPSIVMDPDHAHYYDSYLADGKCYTAFSEEELDRVLAAIPLRDSTQPIDQPARNNRDVISAFVQEIENNRAHTW